MLLSGGSWEQNISSIETRKQVPDNKQEQEKDKRNKLDKQSSNHRYLTDFIFMKGKRSKEKQLWL
jgi:hypothetical protein